MCRTSYVQTLGIAGDLIPVIGLLQKGRSPARGFPGDRREDPGIAEDVE
jgi:hypothetical protein